MNFERLVGDIYEAATDPDQWPEVLHGLARTVGGPAGLLVTRRNDRWMGYRCSPAMQPGADAYVFSEAAGTSQTTPRLLGFKRAGFVADHELFSDDEFVNDVMMTNWAGRLNLHHGAATAIHIPNGDVVVVQVQRSKGQPCLDRSELERLDAFRPHLARAGLLAARWRLDRVRAVAEALALIGLPAAILGAGGRVLAVNGLVEALSTHVVWLPDDQIALTDRSATALLRNAFSTIGDPGATTVRSFPARAAGSGESVVVHLIPATGRTRDLFEGGFAVLVITPVSAPRSPDPVLIRALFDLTAAEARVACDVGEGRSVGEIAARHGVTDNTVRTQLKMVFTKTGTSRQSEVAALVAGLPKLPLA